MTKIHYVGCDSTHASNFIYDIPKGHDFWLLILAKTPTYFLVDGEIKEYPAHSAVLYHPYQKIYYRTCGERFTNDWIRFDTTESYITNTILPLGIPFSLDDPEYCYQLFKLLSAENTFNKDYKDSSIDYLLHTVFNKLFESYQSTQISPQYYNLMKLRMEIHNNPGRNWTVARMADYLHISAGYLQSIYKNTFEISCMDDVIHSRIRLAKEFLIRGSHSTSEVALLCGYHNIEHFCRQFKLITGCTPGAFRSISKISADANTLE